MRLQLWQINPPHEEVDLWESLALIIINCPPFFFLSFFKYISFVRVNWILIASNLLLYIPLNLMSNHLSSQWILVLCLRAPLGKFSNGEKKNNLPHLASLWHLQSLSTSSRTLPDSCGVTFCDQHELMLAPLLDLMTVELRMKLPFNALPSLAGNKSLCVGSLWLIMVLTDDLK